MIVRLDLHTHSRFSADGISEPEGMIDAARKAGLDGFAITDHDTCQAVDYFMEAGLMREDGLPVDDFLIIPGQEISTAQGHLLALGVVLPMMKGVEVSEAVDEIHQRGGIAIPAHPLDGFRSGIRPAIMDSIPIDAVEVFNSASTFSCYNRQAARYALKRELPGIAASDAHHEQAIGVSHTSYEVEQFDLRSILEAVKTGGILMEKSMGIRDFMIKTFHNAFRSPYRHEGKRS
jgi:predicted metal-dependent phosphoesterase TrpH